MLVLICPVLFGRLVLNPFRVVLMNPFMAVTDPPGSIMPDVIFVVIAYHHRPSRRPVITRSGIKAGLERERPEQQHRYQDHK
jgi:hypothetical protein